MYPTCGFSAAPRPTIVFLISAGEYSAIGDPGHLGGQQDDAAGVAQHHRGPHVLAVERALHRDRVGRVPGDERGRCHRE